jgi:hypothetical protein
MLKTKKKGNSMKKLLVLLVLISGLFAQSITGAFGFKLGGKFNPKNAIGTSETTSGITMYQINPIKKVKFFSSYYVIITPTSKKIRTIWGIGQYPNNDECLNDLDVLKIILQKKYGKPESPISMNKTYIFTHGNRGINIKCINNYDNADLYIQYIDLNLDKLAVKEKAAKAAKKIGNDSL